MRYRFFLTAYLAIAVTLSLGASPALADKSMPQNTGFKDAASDKVVLTLNGPKGKQRFSPAQLENLGLHQVSTSTFWPEDNGTYAGPLLVDVLRQAGLDKAEAVRIRARDGFSQILPRQDWEKWPVMLATRYNGKPMGVHEKGPLRVIYPRDMSPELSDSIYRLRWVWLVDSIEAVGHL